MSEISNIIDIPETETQANKGVYTSPERLYLDKNGAVVAANHPERASLLICAGGIMPLAHAIAHGLIEGNEKEPQTDVENKALPTTAAPRKPRGGKSTQATPAK